MELAAMFAAHAEPALAVLALYDNEDQRAPRDKESSATDDQGFHVTSGDIHVHDLNATVLHCLGIDHTRLTFRLQGRDYRLPDVHGQVARQILS